METTPLIIEHAVNAAPSFVWDALTNNDKMKRWYFEIPAFEPEIGYKFEFSGGPEDGEKYLHQCIVTAVEPERKISYTWNYAHIEGSSEVSFDLIPQGDDKTLVRVNHIGLETFPKDRSEFARESFEQGWNYIIGTNLKNFVEQR
ncbi:SRPBCC domain-containing protein [Mucilaginibacter pallidiroseus]|uniref:SRPBCC domain-containing protein n=1 Tax=Mucilaginibacter pallidiroseus TaxID=2599295 RepID=A0A563UCA8_9SPHI|nr:SRPBCC domain-containing protein [Mucilaginibacter pallidiroseus]TWR28960.1 SRPBCC domain-containing protein [Mucilaginibacter pallidiroseus]